MRLASLALAFAFLLGGPSLAGAPDGGLPAIGSFAYQGAPAAAPQATFVVASVR